MVQAQEKFVLQIGNREAYKTYKFIIPKYQRPYSWELSNCQDLWDSFISLINDPKNNGIPYFMGSIILKKDNIDTIEIIDGQQRIISISLILLYLYYKIQPTIYDVDVIKDFLFQYNSTTLLLESKITADNDAYTALHKQIKDHTFKETLVNDNNFDKAKESLENTNKKSKKTDDKQEKINIYERNYQYFILCIKEYLNKNHNTNIQDLAKEINDLLIKKIQVIEVNIQDCEDAIEIFNNMNSKGLPLSVENLVKSALFADLSDDKNLNEEWDTEFRNPDERFWDIKGNHNNFFNYYFKIVLRETIDSKDKDKEIRDKYLKEYLLDKDKTAEINDILAYVKIYKKLCNFTTDDSFYSFVYLCYRKNTFVLWPILMLTIKEHQEKITEIANALENVLMHLHINNKSLQSLNKDLFTILKGYKTDITEDHIYKNVYSYVSLKDNKYNDNIKDNIFDKPFLNNKKASIILEMLEIQLQLKTDKKLHTIISEFKGFNKVSLEHIYPVNSTQWNDKLTPEDDKYLIGNMIILNGSLNSSVSNGNLATKKNEYNQEKYKLKYLKTFDLKLLDDDSWTSKEIEARCKDLYEKFIKIYTYKCL